MYVRRPWVSQLLFSACVAFLAIILSGTAAQAQPDPFDALSDEDALRLVDNLHNAETAERQSRWMDAVDHYHEAWMLVPIEEYRFRQAYCLEQAGEHLDALEIYTELSESERTDIETAANQRTEAIEQLLADLPGRLRIMTDHLGAMIIVDDQTSRLAEEREFVFEVSPGEHEVVVELDGYETEQHAIHVEPGGEAELHIRLALVSEAEATESVGEEPEVAAEVIEGDQTDVVIDVSLPPDSDSDNIVLPILFGGLALAAVGTGVAFGVMANDTADDAWSYDINQPGANDEAQTMLNDRADSYVLAANLSYASAGAFAVGAILSIILGGGDDDIIGQASQYHPMPQGVEVRWQF